MRSGYFRTSHPVRLLRVPFRQINEVGYFHTSHPVRFTGAAASSHSNESGYRSHQSSGLATAATTAGAIDTCRRRCGSGCRPRFVSVGLAVTQPVATTAIEARASRVDRCCVHSHRVALAIECLRIKSRRLAEFLQCGITMQCNYYPLICQEIRGNPHGHSDLSQPPLFKVPGDACTPCRTKGLSLKSSSI